MNTAYWLNTAWMWSCRPELRAFQRATCTVAATQEDVLRQMIAGNVATDFGRQHDFRSIRCVRDYQRRVPLATFDSYAAAIEQIAGGRCGVLSADAVELLEPTSGTMRGEKLIPYTKALRRQFHRAVSAWIADVMRHCPGVRRGRAYWSISPAAGPPRTTQHGIPIGFDNDAAYLGRLARLCLRRLLIMPPAVTRLRAMENFQYGTLLHLLAADDLALISVWSPTYLTSLLAPLDPWTDRLCRDLQRGRASLPVPDDPGASESLCRVSCRSDRPEQVRRILTSHDPTAEKLRRLWPRLSLISCWADASAANYLGAVRALFPHVPIQPKGLLATEACVSFPLMERPGAAVAVRSHFFEFLPVDASGGASAERPQLAHQLETGGRYQVVVTTGGGLYRYRLGDEVQVVGFENQCPLITFLGRTDRVSDLVGEKLDESHVSAVLNRVFHTHGLAPQFSLLVPRPGNPPGYRLYLDTGDASLPQADWSAVVRDVERGLRENPYYRHALQWGQLQPLDLRVAGKNEPRLGPLYERVLCSRGQRPGDIKPAALDAWSGWSHVFDGQPAGPELPTDAGGLSTKT